ncbi:MAG: 16S rRNA (adenine(1518)-N(6)/adenine(1519)-N(6))-dimethyltransferase RsmA [Oscillospiraceae bacterium]|jgi:16S rRNA (adenine1518-N6/adenine1519-N6)-dimethyltransferase|nr:16S rRNA (adenine(1518)-N(6)/adenine(1519)-N(6))-dimethyltransferase RsmA [Oscillospiraceae bacterium]
MKHSLGQNFLTSDNYPKKIAAAAYGGGDMFCTDNITRNVLEIGAGEGILTRQLSALFGRVVSVEIDTDLTEKLTANLQELDNVSLVFADYMKLDRAAFFAEQFQTDKFCVCANIPYYITSPIITELLENYGQVTTITVLVQREAAERFAAIPGKDKNCSAASVCAWGNSTPKILFNVKRGNFFPVPDVDSAVIQFDKTRPFGIADSDRDLFFGIARACFGQRRKQIVNPLSEYLKTPKDTVAELLVKCGVSPQCRAENITMENWNRICGAVKVKC